MISRPLGGNLTIAVVDPIEALGIRPTAAKPRHRPATRLARGGRFPVRPGQADAGWPALKSQAATASSSTRNSTGLLSDDDMDFDLADYV